MAKLNIRASSLVELIIATVIICISFTSISFVFIHYLSHSQQSHYNKTDLVLSEIEKQILNDTTFPNDLDKYQKDKIKIEYRQLFNSDSIFHVKVLYSDSNISVQNLKQFIYVKD